MDFCNGAHICAKSMCYVILYSRFMATLMWWASIDSEHYGTLQLEYQLYNTKPITDP